MLPTAPANHEWSILRRDQLLAFPPWIEVHREAVALPSGRIINDFYQVVLPEFVVVVALTKTRHMVMVRGYKHGLKRVNLSPPAGLIEPTEEPLQAAKRELLEETGYEADDWSYLGRYVIDGNRGCGAMHLVTARNARCAMVPQEDDAEQLAVELMDRETLLAVLRAGEIGNLAGAGGLALAIVLSEEETHS